MNILSVSNLARHGREDLLFSDVTFGLDEGEKAALIGRNGTGKSTLLACVAGILPPDAGTIVVAKTAGVSYLPQTPAFDPGDTIRDHVFRSDSPKLRTIREYESVCERVATDQSLHARLDALTREMDEGDLWNMEAQVRSTLSTLGLEGLDRVMGTLSGGMLKKVALAQVLVEDTKLLLLDEPTNHLDIATIAWLEGYLRDTDRTVLMVTHDRYFLDAVCGAIYELDNRKLTLYEGNFSRYLEKKAIAEEIAANADARIESVLRTEREWLLRGPQARGTKAKARIDSIHRMMNREKLAKDKGFEFEVTGRRLGGKILEAENVSKSYPVRHPSGEGNDVAGANGSAAKTRTVIQGFSYAFKKGEKLGVFGDNGAGKSTLLNILTGSLAPDAGVVTRGDNTVIAYYRQNPEIGDTPLTVIEYIKEVAETIAVSDGKVLTASQLLERFGFSGKIQYSPVASLSGGERKRVYLVRLLMTNPNFIVLDEPTNDFDIYTLSVLEGFLASFAGCLLVVSHDRYFMDRVADTLLVIEDDGSVSGFVGSCTEYLAYRGEEAKEAELRAREEREKALAKEARAREPQVPGGTDAAQAAAGSGAKPKKRSFKEQREYEGIEAEIEALETRKGEIESLLSGGETDHVRLRALGEEFKTVSERLEERYGRWEYLASLG
jgi:ATP-binding cassette subfamily F protein uup